MYYTELREGEALALNWNDYINETLDINKTISKELVDNKRVINTPKTTKSNRKVKFDNGLVKKLNDLKEFYKSFEGFTNEWFIFGGLNPLSLTTVGRKKNKYCKLANVKK